MQSENSNMSTMSGSASMGKKVLLVTRPLTPPWDEASKIFAYFLAKNVKNFTFTVLTDGDTSEIPEYVEQKAIYKKDLKLFHNLSLLQRMRILKIFPIRKQFDIIHFMMTPAKLNALGFKYFIANKYSKSVQTVATLREDLLKAEDFKKILFADLVITYSDYAKRKLEQIGIKNVTRIYPGIDVQRNCPLPKDKSAQALFKLEDTDFVITYPGEYTRLGATDDLVNLLPSLFAKIPTAKFVFACRIKNEKDVAKKAEVVAKLTQAGIIQRVVFTDTFAEMPKIYNMSDIIVFPVRDMKGKFDVPLIVIEAMACAKPVIISDLPILQELSSQENSLSVETGNAQQFIDICQQLFNSKETCQRIGKKARQYVLENFDIKDVAKKYEQAYNDLLAK